MPTVARWLCANEGFSLGSVGDSAYIRQHGVERRQVRWMQSVWKTEENQHLLSPELRASLPDSPEQLRGSGHPQ
eukprot:6995209-Alexandrium_andersonii.AAC.1